MYTDHVMVPSLVSGFDAPCQFCLKGGGGVSTLALLFPPFSSKPQVKAIPHCCQGSWVLCHPLVDFLNLFVLLLIVPAITPLNGPSVSCQDCSQVNLGDMF